jgi:hypothetical protein
VVQDWKMMYPCLWNVFLMVQVQTIWSNWSL